LDGTKIANRTVKGGIKMADNKENSGNKQESGGEDREVHIEPSETENSKRMDPGRTPGKAEGKDDESATE